MNEIRFSDSGVICLAARIQDLRIPRKMIALVTGVGFVALALGAGDPGREIQQPMAVVIIEGIVTPTVLNMIVIPAFFLKIGQDSSQVPGTAYSERNDFDSAGN
jgi:Cu/Ag efflux pump CusA